MQAARKSRRLSARWFSRALWLVALMFAAFLAGLGSVVVDDLPRVEHHLQLDDVLDKGAATPLRATIDDSRRIEEDANRTLEQANLKLEAAKQAYGNGRDTFANWVATRKATSLPSQDEELIARTKELDALKTAEIDAQHLVEAQQKAILDADQARSVAQDKLEALQAAAADKLQAAADRAELRVFLYRLALTLPLLGIAGWLFAKKRNGTWWPFAWGFIFFALFAFFVEAVPYLPSYGGYVYYGVGLIVTVLVGRFIIVSLNRYLARQVLVEQQPDTVRRKELDYDIALARLAKGVCPGCERPVDLKSGENSFCPHCGIGLHDNCGACSVRKSAFAHFCHACGAPAGAAAVSPGAGA